MEKAATVPGRVTTSVDVTIRTVFKLHQREYFDEVLFSEREYRNGWPWLGAALRIRAERSHIRLEHKSAVSALKRALAALEGLEVWVRVVRTPVQSCTAADISAVLAGLEALLLERLGPTAGARNIFREGRKMLWEALAVNGNERAAEVARRRYVSIFPPHVREGRQLISDLADGRRPPLSAVPHKTYAELRENSKQILQSDLDRILQSCREVLDRYDKALGYLRKLEEMEISEICAKEVMRKLVLAIQTSQRKRSAPVRLSESEFDLVLALVKRGKVVGLKSHGKKTRWPPQLNDYLRKELQGIVNQAHIVALLDLDIAPPAEVLLACALIIQIHSHWNFISVLELDRDQIDVKSFPHQLQSVKPRPGDDTPPAFIERNDHLILKSLKVLLERWKRLVAAERISVHQKGLWYSSRSILARGKVWPVVAWGPELRGFTKKYGLPAFSLEQIRVQCLALVSVGARGLSGVMQTAGHASDATSLRYIDKLLLRRLNAANTLEFERRLEKTIVYMMGRTEWRPELIAYPVGDGSSCANPALPPDENWADAGICRAENCHQKDGCPNRRIVMTAERIEEIARTKDYYVTNWKRLADENSTRFESVHLPQMLFNLALYGVLRRGPYRHLVAKYEH